MFILAGRGPGTSHLVENLINRLAEMQATEQPVHRVVVVRSFPKKDRAVTKLELDNRPRFQSKLFAQLDRNRELSLGRHRAFQHD